MSNLATLNSYFKEPRSKFKDLDYKPEFLDGLPKSSRFDFVNRNRTIVNDMLEPSKLNSKDDLLNAAGVAGAVDYADAGQIPDLIMDPSLKNIRVYGYDYMDKDITIKDPSLQNIQTGPPLDHMSEPIEIKDPIMVPIVSKDLPPTIKTGDQVIIEQFIKDLADALRMDHNEKILKKEFFDDKYEPLLRSYQNKELSAILKPYKKTMPRPLPGDPKPIVLPGRIIILPIIESLILNYTGRTDLKDKVKYIGMLNIIKVFVN